MRSGGRRMARMRSMKAAALSLSAIIDGPAPARPMMCNGMVMGSPYRAKW
jgi:hypothetical protein